ncbi:MAG TPA: CmcJ/NvfI family oxidoreductase, partial [Geminicoccaceae bacterium]|nr:CmcJ/NvfI family oxidoreductase [Geminicoccaceae bacterium]
MRAALTFITRSDAKPVFHSSALTGAAPRVFFETERHVVPIRDLRPLAGALSLDHEGFELLRHETAASDLYDDAGVENVYYQEVEALLRAATGASRVVIFDATRRSDGGAGASNRDGLRGPASRVHVDYTAKSGPQRVKDLLGEAEAARL